MLETVSATNHSYYCEGIGGNDYESWSSLGTIGTGNPRFGLQSLFSVRYNRRRRCRRDVDQRISASSIDHATA